jgi:SAM-dependent methyltransferase
MSKDVADFEYYFSHLKSISFLGRMYKRFFSSPIIYYFASRFGDRVIEVGSGTGSGVLGTFSKYVSGLDINPAAVGYCRSHGMTAQLINDDGVFPVADESADVCVLDNVLEHIEKPRQTLDECYRITVKDGGLVIVVPGICGYKSDSDHKIFYSEQSLKELDERWLLVKIFSIPFFASFDFISKNFRQYCLVAIYKKV